jgi:hypothetical protein
MSIEASIGLYSVINLRGHNCPAIAGYDGVNRTVSV